MSLILIPSIFLYLRVCSILTLGRTRKFIPPTVVQGDGGGWNPSPEFLICSSCSILKRFYL